VWDAQASVSSYYAASVIAICDHGCTSAARPVQLKDGGAIPRNSRGPARGFAGVTVASAEAWTLGFRAAFGPGLYTDELVGSSTRLTPCSRRPTEASVPARLGAIGAAQKSVERGSCCELGVVDPFEGFGGGVAVLDEREHSGDEVVA
jgi:hypothetical protein